MQWENGKFSSSLSLLNGLIYLGVSACAIKGVGKNKRTIRGSEALDAGVDIEWEAEIRGSKKIKVGKFATREEAIDNVITAFKTILRQSKLTKIGV